jgi:transposase-like protein
MTPPERRAALVREYKASGLTQAAFARREGLRNSTFAYWVLQSAKAGAEAAKRPIEFAQLRLPVSPPITAEPAHLEVRLPDGTLLRGDNANDLAVLVRALRA